MFRQNLVFGTDDVHFMNREQAWLMHLANDGTLLHSLKVTHATENVQLIGITPLTNGIDFLGIGFVGSNDCFIISMARSDLTIKFNRILVNKKLYHAQSDLAGRMYIGGYMTDTLNGILIRLNENLSPMEFDLQVKFSHASYG